MLKLKYLFENYELAKECLCFYDYDQASLDEMLRYFRISSNEIYPFRSGKNKNQICFLRLSPVEETSTSKVQSEVCLIRWLLEKGCNVMKPIPMKNGKFVDVITTIWGTYNVSCFERVEGMELEDVRMTLDIAKGYGKILGTLHETLKMYPHTKDHQDHRSLLAEIRSKLQALDENDFVLSKLDDLEKELAKLPINEKNYGIIHYDFEPDNVFYDQAADSFSIIDFDDAMQCWYALDVARALDSLKELVEDGKRSEAQEAFLMGYQSVCDFTKEQKDTLPLMRQLIKLQSFATILYVISEPLEHEPQWLIKIKEKLINKLHALEESMHE